MSVVAVAVAQLPQHLLSSCLDCNICKSVLDTVGFTCKQVHRNSCFTCCCLQRLGAIRADLVSEMQIALPVNYSDHESRRVGQVSPHAFLGFRDTKIQLHLVSSRLMIASLHHPFPVVLTTHTAACCGYASPSSWDTGVRTHARNTRGRTVLCCPSHTAFTAAAS
jgi:hypothetical protein